jgi:hypothetical protein
MSDDIEGLYDDFIEFEAPVLGHPRFNDATAEKIYAGYLLASGMAKVEDEEFKKAALDLLGILMRSIPTQPAATLSRAK